MIRPLVVNSWFLQNEVERIVKDDANDDKMIALLLDLKSFAGRVVETSFISTVSGTVDSPDFAYAVRSAFSNGFKVRRQKPAELLAKHLDRTMRRGQRGTSDYDYNDQLKGVLALHRFTDDKDVFRTFYHRLLAKRLLLSKSASDDFEKSVLKILKEGQHHIICNNLPLMSMILEYDDEFHMGDQMFKDLHISRDLMTQYYRTSHAAEQNVSVMVLQRSFWPFSVRRNDIVLPIEVHRRWIYDFFNHGNDFRYLHLIQMQKQVDGYNTYYQNKFKGRKLDFDVSHLCPR
jgi:cullin-4